MLFVTTQISDDAEIKIRITKENVFCECPKCGCETNVDLSKLLGVDDLDEFVSEAVYESCQKDLA